MLRYRFAVNHTDRLEMVFDEPYAWLGLYMSGDIQATPTALGEIERVRSVIDGRVAHASSDGNAWWLEIGPETTRMGNFYWEPETEREIPTKWLLEALEAFRDAHPLRLAQYAKRDAKAKDGR